MDETATSSTFLLGRIDGKLDAALVRLDAHDRSIEDLDQRVSSLEAAKYWVYGAAAAAPTIVSVMFWLFQSGVL